MTITLHHGDCLDVLRGMEDGSVDAVVTDPPYSERTHSGHDKSASGRLGHGFDGAHRRALCYDFWTRADVDVVVPELCRVSAGWVVVMTDHMLVRPIQAAMEAADRYAFAPLPYVETGSRCRLAGDGPSCWAVWICVCRPKTRAFATWGTLPGAYLAGSGWRERRYPGGKPLQLMQALIRDYSRIGDMVLDPFMGSGTTGVACVQLGRDFIGVELDEDYFEVAKARIVAAKLDESRALFPARKRKQRRLL